MPSVTRVLCALRLPSLPWPRLLGGRCTTVDTYMPTLRSFGVYKLDINQGNYLSQDMVDKLKVGQTQAQVRQLLGTPLLVSAFRDNRWDYVYEFTRQGQVRRASQVHRLFRRRQARALGGRRDAASMAELNREALSKTSAEDRWGKTRSWWDDIVDVFGN